MWTVKITMQHTYYVPASQCEQLPLLCVYYDYLCGTVVIANIVLLELTTTLE